MSTLARGVSKLSEKPRSKGRTFRGQSGDERKAERQQRLIQAGIAVFGARGFHTVTVREICAAAKLTERYFYESFENMSELFIAVFADVNLTLKNMVLRAIMQAPREPLALIEAYLRAYFGFIQEDPTRSRIIGFEALAVNAQVRVHVERAIEDYANTVRGFMLLMFPTLLSDSRLSADLVSHGMVGANIYIAERWVREDFRTPFDEVIEANMVIYRSFTERVKGLLATPPAPAPAPEPAGKASGRSKKERA